VKSAAAVDWVYARRRRADGTMTDNEIAQMPEHHDYGPWRQWRAPGDGVGEWHFRLAPGWESHGLQVHGCHQPGNLLRVTPLDQAFTHLRTGARIAIMGVAAAAAPDVAQEFMVVDGPVPTWEGWDAASGDAAVIWITPPLNVDGPAPTVVEMPTRGALIMWRR
jgi:hypothetical protein